MDPLPPGDQLDVIKNRTLIIILGVVAVIVLIFIIVRKVGAPGQTADEAATQANNLSSAVEDISEASEVVVPTVNPAREAAPAVNPLEKTNPFKNEYTNPFE